MLLWEKIDFENEEKRLSQRIVKWSNSRENFLNIISVPYNSTEIFIGIIKKYILENKKILYITDEPKNKINIIDIIKKHTNFRNYTYVNAMNNIQHQNICMKICNFNMSMNLHENFNLVICDDISSFSRHSKYDIFNILEKLSVSNNKVIVYSIEKIIENCKEMILPVKYSGAPIVEPRMILTRLNINKGIPFVVYDYLKWSIHTGRKVVICVPDEERVDKVSSYIKQYCSYFLKNVVCFVDNKLDEKLISQFESMEDAVLITNCFQNFVQQFKNSDIMIYFADNPSFNYKKIIYLCGSVMRGEKDLKGEVILLANSKTADMERAKSITRNFNKEAWNMGLLKV